MHRIFFVLFIVSILSLNSCGLLNQNISYSRVYIVDRIDFQGGTVINFTGFGVIIIASHVNESSSDLCIQKNVHAPVTGNDPQTININGLPTILCYKDGLEILGHRIPLARVGNDVILLIKNNELVLLDEQNTDGRTELKERIRDTSDLPNEEDKKTLLTMLTKVVNQQYVIGALVQPISSAPNPPDSDTALE